MPKRGVCIWKVYVDVLTEDSTAAEKTEASHVWSLGWRRLCVFWRVRAAPLSHCGHLEENVKDPHSYPAVTSVPLRCQAPMEMPEPSATAHTARGECPDGKPAATLFLPCQDPRDRPTCPKSHTVPHGDNSFRSSCYKPSGLR